MSLQVFPIEFASDEYDAYIALRDRILRKPLDLEFSAEELSDESEMFHFGVYQKSNIIACFVLVDLNDGLIKMRQVAVDETYQNKGIGTLMVNYCEAWCMLHAYKKIVLNARIPAVAFYTKNKYNKTGKEFIEVGIPHQKMEKKLT